MRAAPQSSKQAVSFSPSTLDSLRTVLSELDRSLCVRPEEHDGPAFGINPVASQDEGRDPFGSRRRSSLLIDLCFQLHFYRRSPLLQVEIFVLQLVCWKRVLDRFGLTEFKTK